MSSSTIRRKRLEAELEHQRRQAQITNRLAEQQQRLAEQQQRLAEQERQVATAEFQLRQAELDEEEDERLLALGDQFSDLDPDDNERVQRWLNTEHAQKANQLETETAHTHSEVADADADADAPTADSTAADSTAAHGSGPDFTPQPDPVSHSNHLLVTCTSIGTSAPVTITNTSSPTNTMAPDVTLMNQTSTTTTTSLASTQSSSTPTTTSSHPPMNAQISKPTLAVSLPALAPTTCAPQRAAPQSAPQPATTSFSLSLSTSPQHVTYQNALPPAPAAVLPIMTHVHAPSVTISAPLPVVAQPQQTRSVHVPHTSGRGLGPLTLNATQPAVQTSTTVGSSATRVGSQLPSMSVASQPPVTHPTAATFPPSASSTMHPHVLQQRSHTTTDDAVTRLADTLSSVLQPRPAEQAAFTQYMARQTQGNQLPSFSGSPEEWPVFKALYDSSTTACGFTNADNLARLQRCLKGTAKDMVHALLSVPDNVPNIVRTLEMRYGRPDVIIQSLVSKVTALPPVGENRHTELLDFAVTVQNLVTTIANVNAQAHLHNPSLMTELVDRLPPSLRLPWGEQVAQLGPTNVNLEHFSKWLTAKANAPSFVMRPQPKPTPAPAAATALVAVVPPRKPTSRPQSTRPLTCAYCDKPGHYADECKRYSTLQERRQQINTQKRCYLCLSKRHTSDNCHNSRPCVHCKRTGRHHRSLCPTKFGRLASSSSSPRSTSTQPQHTDTSPPPSTRTEPANLAAGQEEVRMQTATAQVAHLGNNSRR